MEALKLNEMGMHSHEFTKTNESELYTKLIFARRMTCSSNSGCHPFNVVE